MNKIKINGLDKYKMESDSCIFQVIGNKIGIAVQIKLSDEEADWVTILYYNDIYNKVFLLNLKEGVQVLILTNSDISNIKCFAL